MSKKPQEPEEPVLGYDPEFGQQLDTRGLPLHLEEIEESESGEDPFIDTAFGIDVDRRGQGLGKGLKALLAHPDREAVVEISQQTRNPKLLEEFDKENTPSNVTIHAGGEEHEASVYKRGQNWTVQIGRRKFTALDRDSALGLATRELTKEAGPVFHELSAEEELLVARMCSSAAAAANSLGSEFPPNIDDAIAAYLSYKVGNIGENINVAFEPKYLPACNEASFFCFKHSTPEFKDTPEAREFMADFLQDRPLSVPLLRSAFAAWKTHQKEQNNPLNRSRLLHPENFPEPESDIPSELEALDTEEVESLFHRTLQERARAIRSGRG